MIRIRIYPVLFLFAFSLKLTAQYDFSADVTEGCDSLTVHFSFSSTASIDTVTYIIWDLGNGEVDTTLNVSDILTVTYKMPSRFTIIVYVNDFTNGEPFSKMDYIIVHHSVTADFTAKDTSQPAPYSYQFRDSSRYFDNSTTFSYNWNFDDGTTSGDRNVVHTFPSPGIYLVSFTVSDSYGCTSTASHSLNIPPVIPTPDIIADRTEGCDSLRVKFSLINIDTSTITSIFWDFGNGETSTAVNPDTILYTAGNIPSTSYAVSAVINGDTENPIEKVDFITVYHTVRAYFECRDTLSSSDYVIKVCYNLDPLFDTSAVYQFEWIVQGFDTIYDTRPVYTFANMADTVMASLTIDDLTHGCSDTRNGFLYIEPEILVQNVFTPNGDGVNDYFNLDTDGSVLLNIKIFSRSGLLVYEGEGTDILWDGKSLSGVELNPGIYFYILTSLSGDPDGKYDKTGFVYLFK